MVVVVEADLVFEGVDEVAEAGAQVAEFVGGAAFAFEDRQLYSWAVTGQQDRDVFAALVVGDVVGDENDHEITSSAWLRMPRSGRGGGGRGLWLVGAPRRVVISAAPGCGG